MLVKTPALKSDNYEEIIKSVRQLQLDDRVMYDKANRAFVSYIQAYSKYECNLILRVKGQILNFLLYKYKQFFVILILFLFADLDLCKLAYGFGLLKLPKMPELKNKNTSGFIAVDIDLNTIKYK